MEYYSAIKRKEILPFGTLWMDLKGIVLNEMSDRERQTLYVLTYIWNLKKLNSWKLRVEWWLPGTWGLGKYRSKGTNCNFKLNKFWGSNVQYMVIIINNTVLFVFFFLTFGFYLFIYLWLCWVFVSVRGLSLVAASGGHSSSRCAGLSLSWPLLLRSTGSRRTGSVIVAHGPSCSAARGIFPDQGLNPCPLHWQADSQPLRHQGSPICILESY